jgi:hypothetical protein
MKKLFTTIAVVMQFIAGAMSHDGRVIESIHSQTKQINKPRTRCRFTANEDRCLTNLVQELGTKAWDKMAKRMPERTPRQVRERWKSLSGTNREPLTLEEKKLLIEKVTELGPRWVKITAYFPGRNDIALKNGYRQLRSSLSHKKKSIPSALTEPREQQLPIAPQPPANMEIFDDTFPEDLFASFAPQPPADMEIFDDTFPEDLFPPSLYRFNIFSPEKLEDDL